MSTSTEHADEHGHEHSDGRVHPHISSFGFLCGIFLTLIVLTVVTVAASYVDFGSANTLVAVLIATIKAGLVATFFMHLRHDKPFLALAFIMAFVFLGVFGALSMEDLGTRGRLDIDNGVHVLSRTGEVAPGSLNTAMMRQHPPEGHGHGGGEHGAAPSGEHGAAPAPAAGGGEHGSPTHH